MRSRRKKRATATENRAVVTRGGFGGMENWVKGVRKSKLSAMRYTGPGDVTYSTATG